MLAQPTEGAGSGTPRPAAATTNSSASQQLTADFDAFLELMTTQMRHQDPLEPLDGTEFVAQLAQFSGVEQQIKTNDKLDAMSAALTRSAGEVALGFLGRVVETASGRIELTPGESARFAFETDQAEKKLLAVIRDDSGDEVHTFRLDADGPGRHEALWDGRDAGGNQLAAGTYTVQIDVYDDAGDEVVERITPLTRGEVLEARLDGERSSLILSNGSEVGLDELKAIST